MDQEPENESGALNPSPGLRSLSLLNTTPTLLCLPPASLSTSLRGQLSLNEGPQLFKDPSAKARAKIEGLGDNAGACHVGISFCSAPFIALLSCTRTTLLLQVVLGKSLKATSVMVYYETSITVSLSLMCWSRETGRSPL